MQPCNFPNARPIGKPNEWDESLDGECLTIYVSDTVDTLSGLPIMYSCYKLNDDEIEALRNGGLLRLGIVGIRAHPVFQLNVLSPRLTKRIQPIPVGDMGSVIDA